MTTPGTGSSVTTNTAVKPSPISGSFNSAVKLSATPSSGQVRGTIKVSAAGQGGHALITALATNVAVKHGAAHAKEPLQARQRAAQPAHRRSANSR